MQAFPGVTAVRSISTGASRGTRCQIRPGNGDLDGLGHHHRDPWTILRGNIAVRNASQPGDARIPSLQGLPSASSPETGHGLPSSLLWNRVAWFVWILAGIRLLGRGFDPDELEHLHAAFCLFLGQIPYRDVFEHHAPALYWLAQPVLLITGPNLAALWGLRLLMWLLATLAVFATTRVARSVLPSVGACLTPGLLLGSSIFFSKGFEFRPDGPAMLLLVLVLEQVLKRSESGEPSGFSLSGRNSPVWLAMLAGGATLFTQKAIVPIVVFGMAAWLVNTWHRRLVRWPRELAIMLAGVGVSWCLLLGAYWWVGGAAALLDSTVFQLMRWSVRSDTSVPLRATLAADLLTWWLSAVAIVLGLLWPAWQRWWAGGIGPQPAVSQTGFPGSSGAGSAGKSGAARDTVHELIGIAPCLHTAQQVLLLSVVGCVGSLGVVKATFPQYYLLWFPALTLAAGLGLGLLRENRQTWLVRWAAAGGGLLLVAQLAWMVRGWMRQAAGPFPHLSGENPVGMSLLTIGFFWLAWGLGWMGVANDRRERWLAWGGALALGYGICRQLDLLAWSNSAQVAAIEQLNEQVPPEGRVLDGFTGWGAFRPHAYRIWWLNEFSLGLVTPAELERELLDLFDRNPPEAILDDESLRRLPDSVRSRIEADYDPVEPAPLRLRREVLGTRRTP